MKTIRIYLAGPDVFKEHVLVFYHQVKYMAQEFTKKFPEHRAVKEGKEFRIQIVTPIDTEIQIDGNPNASKDIFTSNVGIIDSADAILANIEYFRGDDPDSGTSFEIGYAYAKAKKVFLFTNDARSQVSKIEHTYQEGKFIDSKGNAIENFNLPCNLMLAEAAEGIYTNVEKALAAIVDHFVD